MFLIDAHQTVLVDDEDALAVADVEQGGRHGIVRGTVGVATELFQLLDAPGLQGIRDGSTHAGMVLMEVDALQLQRLAVEEEASLGIEGNGADACGGQIDIDHLAVLTDGCLHLIKIGISGTPETGLADGERLLRGGGLLRL